MPLPKNARNDRARIDARRERVAALYLAGKSQTAIAAELGVCQVTVSKDLAVLRASWRAAAAGDFGEKQAEELARLSRVEAEAWAGWRRSYRDAETTTTRTEGVPDSSGTGNAGLMRATHARTTRGQAGDPRFLDQVFHCIDARLRMIGAYDEESADAPATVIRVNWDGMVGNTPRPDPITAELARIDRLPAATRPNLLRTPEDQ